MVPSLLLMAHQKETGVVYFESSMFKPALHVPL